MPQFIVLYEQTEIRATVFNYINESQNIYLTYYNVDGICSEVIKSSERVRVNLRVGPNDSVTKSFPIVPIAVGTFTIKIKASSFNSYADTILKNITVTYPGIVKEHSLSHELDPTNRAKRQTSISDNRLNGKITTIINPKEYFQNTTILLNEIDEKIVPGTIRHNLYFIGQRFNPTIKSIEELNHLISKPKGCGEQNMYYMAFNLYSLMYLDGIGKLKMKLKTRATTYLKRAFRQQLNYRKEDGSFSAFINRESSVWLTAFISKVFCQSSPYMGRIMDNKIIIDALKWLKAKQSPEGYWTEIYPILHEKALGGANQGSHTLTAYILIALNECYSYFTTNALDYSLDLNKTLENAQLYLYYQINNTDIIEDSYSLSLITYSMLFNNPPTALRRFVKNLKDHPNIVRNNQFGYLYYNNSFSVETSSYALLAFTKANIFHEISRNISNWLLSQNRNGTFDNTQDTIVALEALFRYHIASMSIQNNKYRLSADVSFNNQHKRSIKFDEENIDVLRFVEVDKNTNNINILSNGNGIGRVELLTQYNVFTTNFTCNFVLEVEMKNAIRIHYKTNEFDPNIFFEKSSIDSVRKELEISPENFEDETEINYNQLTCNSKTRVRRAFWNSVLRRFRPNNRVNNSTLDKSNVQSDIAQEQQNCPVTELPYLGIENPIVQTLNINLRKLINEQGMVILEITLLSGYKVIENDLNDLKNNPETFIEFYEFANSKVIIYFRKVPSMRFITLCFRIYQYHIVENIQSALVKVYDYYKKGLFIIIIIFFNFVFYRLKLFTFIYGCSTYKLHRI